MKVRINKQVLVEAGIWNTESEDQSRFSRHSIYSSDTDKFSLEMEKLTVKEMEKLYAHVENHTGWKALAWKIKQFKKLDASKTVASAETKRLDMLVPQMKAFLIKTPNKWLFREGVDGHMLPYYVRDISYTPMRRQRGEVYPAHVNMSLIAASGSDRITWHAPDLKDQPTLTMLLKREGWYVENEELVNDYKKEIELFIAERPKTGKQYRAQGHAEAVSKENSWGNSYRSVAMERDGRLAKVVMDNAPAKEKEEEDTDRNDEKTASRKFWLPQDEILRLERLERTNEVEEDESYDPLNVPTPVHPFLRVFDLANHRNVDIHISNLNEYVYDETVGDKLVLSKEKKDLVTVLVQGANTLMEDIIEGKTGGIIVLATGVPGTGKTLTAEVYAEAVKKPLYVVQCSQLGTSSSDIETELSTVLARAQRWNAILLIDEADVYIRERGTDIDQNAIVGVFLRVLEYYRGVLFMTSNRATILDDAVISRATAHITYDLPDAEQRARIWDVLSKQFGVKLKDSSSLLARSFPNTSGRTIKNLLKLSRLIAMKEKKPVDMKLVKYAAQFLDGTDKETK